MEVINKVLGNCIQSYPFKPHICCWVVEGSNMIIIIRLSSPSFITPLILLLNWHLPRLKINLSESLKFSLIWLTLRTIWSWACVVLSMQSSYPSCNVHLILKFFLDLIYIRVVPWTTLEHVSVLCRSKNACECNIE